MSNHCIHCYISGRVQGVFYRDTTRRQAKSLGLTGWVRNLSDGRVELVASGPEAQLKALEAWLWEGPPAAEVDSVVVKKETICKSFGDFIVKDG